MKKVYKILITIFLVLVVSGFSSFFYIKHDLYSPMVKDDTKQVFEVKDGQGVKEIVDALKQEGFIRNKWVVFGYLKFKKYDTKLKAGTYLLNKNHSPAQTIEEIVSGRTAMQKITILEGWDKAKIADYLEQKKIASKDDFFMSLTKNWDYEFTKNLTDTEGYLYPDTYYIPYNATADDIIKAMLDNFDKKLDEELRQEIKTQEKTISEIITLASIVEKEVFKKEDREIVAGIFWARMEEGMLLQSDATINYITGLDKPSPTFEETRRSSPYNTYLNKGLPPGPICNPSIESIKAVVYPKMTDYRFYLNRQDTFETIFSITYQEHLENRDKYLK